VKNIEARAITETVSRMFQEANLVLEPDVMAALNKARQDEESPIGREIMDRILENADIAVKEKIPLCQDCGVAVIFLELGQEVHVTGGDLYDAVNEGVRVAYREGYLRKSMAKQPFSARKNTGDNTPAIIHTEIVPGDKLKIFVLPKGAGSENMTRLAMLPPASGRQGIIDFITKAVDESGSNPCPPLVIGIGIGGTSEKALTMAKHAVLRKVGEPGPDVETAALEKEILEKVNSLGVGPMGYGGRITAMAVHIETFPSHIGSMPVAISFQCHSDRHKEAVL
jgi:fumarate hydratase subunit alpha